LSVTPLSPEELKSLLDGSERKRRALIDVREYAEYKQEHILGATPLPRRLLEFRMRQVVPSKVTHVALCDDDGRRARLASQTLVRMGYSRVDVLEGGLKNWVEHGYPIEFELNTSPKIFGEKVFVDMKIPEITPERLHEMMEKSEEPLVIDVRPPEEHKASCIPGAVGLPGGDLLLRIADMMDDPEQMLVLHCAGRTRSIISTATLRRMGYPNAYALRNGTMGWILAGFELERGSKAHLENPSAKALQASEEFKSKLDREDHVQYMDPNELRSVLSVRETENVYLIDVRTREEFVEGHVAGFQWRPAVQAIQQVDEIIAVNDSRIIITCDVGVRSTMVASWYGRMGFRNVQVLRGGVRGWRAKGFTIEGGPDNPIPFGITEARKEVTMLPPKKFQDFIANEKALIIYVDTSDKYADCHIPESLWILRSWLEIQISDMVQSKTDAIGITCADGGNAPLAGATLNELGFQRVAALQGGISAWKEAGLPLEVRPVSSKAPKDVLPFIGTSMSKEDMLRYLTWEQELADKY
jgi:rhodanese-related sulfurtransferase